MTNKEIEKKRLERDIRAVMRAIFLLCETRCKELEEGIKEKQCFTRGLPTRGL